MKVAILHDWLTGFRGGERVLEAICELYPDAKIYTLIHKKDSTCPQIENREIKTSCLNKIPGISTHYRKFLPLFPKAIEAMEIESDVDLVISSSHCVIKGIKKPKQSKHLCYIHSPMRYMYDQFENYFGKTAPFYQRWGAKFFRNYITRWDQKSNENVNHFVANSNFVKKRIAKYYERNAQVIHPFVDLSDFDNAPEEKKENFYLMVTAFAPNKNVDLAIKAFNELGLPLFIIGSGQQESYLRSLAKDNIKFLGNLSRLEVISFYKKAKAFVFPGIEDFGITPLESMYAQTPIIAYKEGGVLETLDANVAEFFEEQSKESLKSAVERFQKRDFDCEELKKRAMEFSKEKFKTELQNEIKQMMAEK